MHKQSILVVVNPVAGGTDKSALLTAVQSLAGNLEVHFTFLETQGAGDEQRIEERIQEIRPHVLVAAGGDGTANLLARPAMKHGLTLGIIPQGSANGLARELNIPFQIPQALTTILQGNTKTIDVLTINDYYCLHLSDLGFNAHVIQRSHRYPLHGFRKYVLSTIQEYLTHDGYSRFTIKTERETYSGEAFMIAIANSSKFGTDIKINPGGEIDDGLFEIVIIKPFPKWQGFRNMFYLLRNRVHELPYTTIYQASKATIQNHEGERLQIDGELAGIDEEIRVGILPKRLKVQVPVSP